MMDTDRIKRRLAALRNYRERLAKIAPKEAKTYLNADITVKGAIERNLQLASDTELDILVLLYKGLELSLAGDDESIIERMKGRLSTGLIAKIRSRRELRNRLIHAYADSAYDKEVFAQASILSDIDEFEREVTKLVQKNT